MVFQSYALYPHMTVRKNIEFPLRDPQGRQGRARAARRSRRRRPSGSRTLLDRKPAQLSGGQRQRVALARAIVRRPDAFLMDEPLSNLDAKLRVQTRAELIELQRRLEATVVYVTHDQVEAMTMGHRIAIMSDGRAAAGRPAAGRLREARRTCSSPASSATRAMNTVTGPVVPDGEGLAVAIASSRVPLPAPYAKAVGDAGLTGVVVGVRPEHLRLATRRACCPRRSRWSSRSATSAT